MHEISGEQCPFWAVHGVQTVCWGPLSGWVAMATARKCRKTSSYDLISTVSP